MTNSDAEETADPAPDTAPASTDSPIRVVIADDHTLVLAGLAGLLELVDDIIVVATAADGNEALTTVAEHRPDVLLLDIQMPVLDGLSTLRKLRADDNPTPVLVLTTFDDDALVLQAVRDGADGYVLKDVSLDRLAGAVRTLAAGGSLIDPTMTERLVRAVRSGAMEAPSVGVALQLSGRERDVLRLLASGYANRDVAETLHLAEGTVKNHISSVLAKLGARDRTAAVVKALRLGLLE